MGFARSSGFSGFIKASGTTIEHDPIIKSDGVGEVFKWLASTGSSSVTIDEDASNILSLSAPSTIIGSMYIGHGAGGDTDSTAVGDNALDKTTAGAIQNTAIGANALTEVVSTDGNTAVGCDVLPAFYGNYATVVGFNAGENATTAANLVAIGKDSASNLRSGDSNTCIGVGSMGSLLGDNNTALGYAALQDDCDDDNAAIGKSALAVFRGSDAVAVGSSAGSTITTATDCTLLGKSATASATSGTANQTVIGASTTGVADNSVTLGNAAVTAIYAAQDSGATVHCGGVTSSGDVSITNTAAAAKLTLNPTTTTYSVIQMFGAGLMANGLDITVGNANAYYSANVHNIRSAASANYGVFSSTGLAVTGATTSTGGFDGTLGATTPSSVVATVGTFNNSLTCSTASAITGSFNSTHANGGYIEFERSGVVKGYIGSAAQLVSGGNDNLEVRANGRLALTAAGGPLELWSGDVKRVTVAATGLTTVYNPGWPLKNEISNSGFDVWSNSTLVEATSGAAPVLDGADAALLNNLLTNGGFDSATTGWSAGNSAILSDETGGKTGNCLQVLENAENPFAQQNVTGLVVGKLYQFNCYIKAGTEASYLVRVGTSSSSTAYLNATGEAAANWTDTVLSVVFEATDTEARIYLYQIASAATGTTLLYDSVTLYEVTPGCVAADNLAFDGWYKDSGITLFRQHNDGGTLTKDGSFYSLKAVTAGTDKNIVWNLSNLTKPENTQRFAGRTITLGAWVKAFDANHIRLGVYDAGWNFGDYHTGGGGWEWLEFTYLVSGTATAIYFAINNMLNAKTAYVSQPMLVFGSAIGAGNYSRPMGEIVMFEKLVNSTGYFTTGFSDVSGTLNVEADSNGCVPKGANGLFLDLGAQDSGSAATDTFFRCGASASLGFVYANTYGLANDALLRSSTALCKCDSNGDIEARVEASGSGTFDAYLQYAGVQLR